MEITHSHWTCDAWFVSTLATGVAVPHIQTGWLEMLRRGFLHRDVSIGNILMLDPPVTTKPFDAWEIKELMKQLSLRYEDEPELGKYAKLLHDAIKDVGYLAKCHGFLIDGNMAARLKGYFTSRDTGEVFVSTRLVVCENPTDDYYAGDTRIHVRQSAGHSSERARGPLSALAH